MRRTAVLLAVTISFTALAFGQEKSPDGPDSVVKVLRTTNKAQTNKYVCEAYEFKHINPYNVINFFWAVTSREEGGVYSFKHPDEERGFVVVLCPEYQLETLRKLAAELDRPKLNSAPGSTYIYHRLKHRNVADPGFLSVLRFYVGSSGVFIPDVETDSLEITDAATGAENLRKKLDEELDQPLPQVELGVRVYEIDVNNDGTMGLDYESWKNGPGKLLFSQQNRGEYIRFRGVPSHHDYRQGGGVYLDYPSAFFDFLVEKGKAKTLIDTKLTALNLKKADLASGEEIIYYKVENAITRSRTSLDVAGDREVTGLKNPRNLMVMPNYVPQQLQAVDTGIVLSITPIIGQELVNMTIDLTVANNTGYDDTGEPVINKRTISDKIAVALGQNVVFGGLDRERQIQTTRKIPILGSLPVLGWLFGGEMTTSQKSVVVAVVSPQSVIDHKNAKDADYALAKMASGEDVIALPRSECMFEQTPSVW